MAVGGFAFGVGVAVSKDEGAIRWATDQEWSRDRARCVSTTGDSSFRGGTLKDLPVGERTIEECRQGVPGGARWRNVPAEVAFTVGAAAVPLIPWLTFL